MADKRMFIYKITNLKSGKIYIGRTCKSIDKRLKEHFCDSKYPMNNSPLHYDMKQFNKEDFVIEKIYEFYTKSFSYADKVELSFIHKYNSLFPNGYNKREVK